MHSTSKTTTKKHKTHIKCDGGVEKKRFWKKNIIWQKMCKHVGVAYTDRIALNKRIQEKNIASTPHGHRVMEQSRKAFDLCRY